MSLCSAVAMLRIIFIILTLYCFKVAAVLVRVEQGLLRGEVLERSTGNGNYCSFKGVPYAAPPVGPLRFRDPQPPLPWKGERSAQSHGPICPQTTSSGKYVSSSNEDCLFLNVYTPDIQPKPLLPVMFYIHGGFYTQGSGNDDELGPDFLLDHGVVLVTINYRLGTLGFLSLGTEDAPGNAGLKDQVAALRWVKKNIAIFGGDPDNVTIFGQSAGGSSVSLHCLSPMSKGLFKRAIAMSGSFFKEFSIPFKHERRAFLLTRQLGLRTQDPKEALQFLRNASVKSLVTSKPFILYSEKPTNDLLRTFFFLPIVENDFGGQHFLTEDPEKLLHENKTNNVELILGHTTNEGIIRTVTQKKYVLKYYPWYKEFLVPTKVTYRLRPKEILELADRIQKHHFGNKEICEDTMKEIFQLDSYLTYVSHIHTYLEMWTEGGNKAYFYEFSCFSERNYYGKYGIKYGVRNATHTDDLNYLFDGKKRGLSLNKDNDSYKMIVQTCSLYTNFAKYGNPTPDDSMGTIWNDYSDNKFYLDIGLELIPKHVDTRPQIDFWRDVYNAK